MYAANAGKGKFIMGAGPVVGFLLGNNYRNYELKDIDIGVNVVSGYEWPIGFFVNVNHVRGLKNLSANKQYIGDFKNYYYGLSLGYMFNYSECYQFLPNWNYIKCLIHARYNNFYSPLNNKQCCRKRKSSKACWWSYFH
jgi:hypothetical protein